MYERLLIVTICFAVWMPRGICMFMSFGLTAAHLLCPWSTFKQGDEKADDYGVSVAGSRLQVDARDGRGSTPLLVALECGNTSSAMLLAKFGADLEVSGKHSRRQIALVKNTFCKNIWHASPWPLAPGLQRKRDTQARTS